MRREYSFSFSAANESRPSAVDAVLAEWENVLRERSHINSLYSSPAWIGHLTACSSDSIRLCLIRDTTGRLVGIVPIRIRYHPLQFDISNRVLLKKRIQVAEILGSTPLLPDSVGLYTQFVDAVFLELPKCDALYFDALPCDSAFWQAIVRRDGLSRSSFVHIIDGPRPWHSIILSSTFEEYLKCLGGKTRSTLRRKVRNIGHKSTGPVEMVKVTEPEQIDAFLEMAVKVSRKSWQHRLLGERIGNDSASKAGFSDLARRGILRAYLLKCGDIPIAFVIGYQMFDVYHYAELAFDEDWSDESPGTVLLYLILEDLHASQPPRVLNFGVGDASYKRRFGNNERSDVSCLIMANRLRNCLLSGSHRVFTGTVKIAKRLVRREVRE